MRGLNDTYTVVYPQLEHLDFTTQAARLDVPVYFLEGRYDILQAPHKELIWFEKSGHTPIQFEPNKLVDVLVNRVLAQASHEMGLVETWKGALK